MNYYIHEGEIYSQDELQHYGVVGMKWGVRRGNYTKAYSKGIKKHKKLKKKEYRLYDKAGKIQKNAYKKHIKAKNAKQREKAWKEVMRGAKVQSKSTKYRNKANKWLDKMEKAFKDVKISDIDKSVLDDNRDYVYMLAGSTDYRRI